MFFFETELNACLRWGTWFDGHDINGKQYDQVVFNHPYVKSFHKKMCYKPADLEKFMSLVGRASMKKMSKMLPLVSSVGSPSVVAHSLEKFVFIKKNLHL